jgi:hypothetical protein
MKIELIRTEELDGYWYKILVDGAVKKCFGMNYITEEQAKQQALETFDRVVKTKCFNSEVIKSEII